VLATGHSARAVWAELLDAGVQLVPKPFAMGFRIEHPQVWAASYHVLVIFKLPAATTTCCNQDHLHRSLQLADTKTVDMKVS